MTTPYRSHDKPSPKNDALHERAVLCARLARLLMAALAALDWQSLRFADRSRLARALMRLTSDARLATLAAEGKAETKEADTVTTPCLPE